MAIKPVKEKRAMYKFKACNNDFDSCGLCGKTHLAKVVWLEDDNGIIEAYGSTCAAKLLRIKSKDILSTYKNVVRFAENEALIEIKATKEYKEENSAYKLELVKSMSFNERLNFMSDLQTKTHLVAQEISRKYGVKTIAV